MTPCGPVRFFEGANTGGAGNQDEDNDYDEEDEGMAGVARHKLMQLKKSLSTPSLSSLYSPPLGQLAAKKPLLSTYREDDDGKATEE